MVTPATNAAQPQSMPQSLKKMAARHCPHNKKATPA
jgi:hypothetical protein